MAEQFHFDPDTYLAMVRAEVPDYEQLQEVVADAAGEIAAERFSISERGRERRCVTSAGAIRPLV